jgi:ribosomal protein L30E
MAKRKELSEEIKLIRSKISDSKALIGADRTLKALRSKGLEKVFLAKNCPQTIKEDVEKFAKMANVDVVVLDQDNEELGVICKKTFFISVIGIEA